MKKFYSIIFVFVFLMVGVCFAGCQSNPTIRFSVYGMNGQNKKTINVKKTDLLKLTNPTSKYFDFVGWFSDQNFENEILPNNPVGYNTSAYAKWTKKNEEFTGIQKIAADIQTLVVAAENFGLHGTNSQIAVLQYIRQNVYNSQEWEAFGGKLSESVYQALTNVQECEYLTQLQTIDQNGYNIDFTHFCATLNVLLRSGITSANSLICGYIGDLAQVAILIESEIPQEQYIQASNTIGAQNGVFSESDFWADVFAATLGNDVLKQNTSFAELFTDKLAKTTQNLVKEFVGIYFKQCNRQAIVKTLQNQFSKTIVNAWIYKNGGASEDAINQTIYAFADYVLNFVAEE